MNYAFLFVFGGLVLVTAPLLLWGAACEARQRHEEEENMKKQKRIIQVGNSLGVVINRSILDLLNLDVGAPVDMEIIDGVLVLRIKGVKASKGKTK